MEAAGTGDLDAVARALADREAAMPGATPSERARALEAGETIARLLTELKRNMVVEHNRLEQLRSAFAKKRSSQAINLQA
jgi:hypothetical protein